MSNHYGNLIVDGIIGTGEAISGGYTFPATIGVSGDALMVSVDIFGRKYLNFKNPKERTVTVLDADKILSNEEDVVLTAGVTGLILPSATSSLKSYRIKNLSGGSVSISGSENIDLTNLYTLSDNNSVELKAGADQWWSF